MLKKINYIFDRGQKIRLIILLLIIIVGAFVELLGVSAVLPLVDVVMDNSVYETNKLYKTLGGAFGITNAKDFIVITSLGLILIYILKNLYICVEYNLQYRYVYNNQRRLAKKILSCYMSQNYLFHVSRNIAELQRNVSNDVPQFFAAVLAFLQLITEALVCILLVIFLILTDITTAFLIIGISAVTLMFFAFILRKKLTIMGQENRKANASLVKWILESLGGIKEIKISNKEEYFLNNYDKAYKKYADLQRRYNFYSVVPRPIMESVSICSLLISLIIQVYFNKASGQFISVLSAFMIAAVRMLPSFNRITNSINALMFNSSSIDAVYNDLMEVESLTFKKKNCIKKEELRFISNIKIKNLVFKYPETDQYILYNCSLTINKKEMVAFIGPSGAGKTTLIDVILGLLEPIAGNILVDGINIQDNLKSWQDLIGYIPQTIYLTDDTIKTNIAFGISDDEIDEIEIYKVLEKAQLKEFVDSLEKGIYTEVGDRGVRLSGGQRQRIGIARALFRNPDILVLDEATSSLDNDTESAVMEAINTLKGNMTIIIIAHRLSTIEKCDKVYEVSNGKIIEKNKEELFNDIHNTTEWGGRT